MKKKILVLGSTGMLGHQIVSYLKSFSEFIVYDISFRNKLNESTRIIDVKNITALEAYIAELQPDYIVNCIGILVTGSHDQENAIYLNAFLPHKLAAMANSYNSKLIHISTDCVFSGSKGQYLETDLRDGSGVYAQTKILGEVVDNIHLTIRTSIVGPELKSNGEGLFHWFMNQNGTIDGYTKAIWSGVTTLELAKAVKWALDCHITGLYHVTNNTPISKFELLSLFQKHTKKNIRIVPVPGKRVDKSFVDTRLLRDYKIPSYDQMVADMISLIANNRKLYSQYKVGVPH
ncbi:SDR family oxidoreductase [Gammaproteobacteria bacterium]|nr:SDR family oxidoreductase [Gammaproteobacteria bacterium]